jgi:hypothetical protein
MRPIVLIPFALVVSITCGCQAPARNSTEEPVAPVAKIVAELRFAIPVNLPTYGTRTDESIHIAVFGNSLARPGWYFLPRGSTLSKAIEAAGGLQSYAGWREPYSGITRQAQNGSSQMMWFNPQGRAAAEKMLLQNGDLLRIAHEVNETDPM